MSLSALPTELIANIFGFLSQPGLYAVALTSKYFHQVAEPILYVNPVFRARREIYAKGMLLTLLKRPELANNVKTMILLPATMMDEHQKMAIEILTERLHKEGWRLLRVVQEIIGTSWPGLDIHSKKRWLNEFTHASMDAYFALILTLALNIQRIEYCYSPDNPLLIVPGLLSHYRSSAVEGASAPLQNLKEVFVRGRPMGYARTRAGSCFVCPPVEHLHLEDVEIKYIECPLPRTEDYAYNMMPSMMLEYFTPTLRCLELHRVGVYPDILLANLRSAIFSKLERLSLRRLGHYEMWYSGDLSYGSFTQTLAEALPEIRDLELSIWWRFGFCPSDPGKAKIPLGNLKDFKKLANVTVDLDLLLDPECEFAPSRFFSLPRTHLPANIESITFTSVKLAFLSNMANAPTIAHYMFDHMTVTCPKLKQLTLKTYKEPGSAVCSSFEEYSRQAAMAGLQFDLEGVQYKPLDRTSALLAFGICPSSARWFADRFY